MGGGVWRASHAKHPHFILALPTEFIEKPQNIQTKINKRFGQEKK